MKNNPRNFSLLWFSRYYLFLTILISFPPPLFFSVEPAMCKKILRQRHDAGSTARKSRGPRRGGKNTLHTYRLEILFKSLNEHLKKINSTITPNYFN